MLFGEVFIHVLCPFFNWVVCFLVLSFVSSLYILDINRLLDISVNMSSHSMGCLFLLMMISFAVQKFLSLI